ncbi:EF-hand domain-containing protein [Sphingomonas bacterium]|uniref:EF-hand domain-containing protein n=1 Tax=Sphingomonas bacterium TaxID=1895847 RepID=UPI0020C7309E|nr:EF-hand domain-containing protein [Sphingomonas bacterium]
MRNVLIAIALASTAIGGAAYGQSDAPPSGQMPPPPPQRGGGQGGGMMAADANHDGIVTREEALAAADRRFDEMDANHDGTITPDEMTAYRDAAMARRGGGATPPPGGPRRGGGRTVTRDEYRARQIERFDRMDTNHDGKIDRTEMANMREMRQGDRREQNSGGTPPPPSGQQ